MYHVNINTSYQIVDFGYLSRHTREFSQRMGRGFLWRRTHGHWSVFVRPFPAVVMSYSRGETAAPWAWMPQAKGMPYVTAPGTPPRPRPGFPRACSSEGTAVLLRVVFHQFLLNLGWVGLCGVWETVSHRKQLLALQDPWSPQNGYVSVTFCPLSLPRGLFGCSKVTVAIPGRK